MPQIIGFSFKCPGERRKGGEIGTCDGLMAALAENVNPDMICYCSKCSTFYLARYKDGIYHFQKLDKSQILFITQPAILDEVHAYADNPSA